MNINSLNTKIKLLFLFCFAFLIVSFFFYEKYEEQQVNEQIVRVHDGYSRYFFENRFQKNQVIDYLQQSGFELSPNPFEVLPNGKKLFGHPGFESLKYKNELYFHVTAPHFRVLFKDNNLYKRSYFAYVLFFIFSIILLFIYFWLIKSLKPLYELRDSIKQFSKGDLTVSCKSNKKDEIAEVSNEFDNAVKKIRLLLDSRQLFLRTVMHELKTPLAKGRIVSELIEDEKQKNRISTIFERLDFLINDFAKVEQVLSNNYKLNLQNQTFKDVYSASIHMLMLENIENKVYYELKESKYRVDLVLYSMIFKNLIDNALKYSSLKSVKICQYKNRIAFISKGEKLEKTLQEYFTPFHNSTKSKNHGMGLGLYIVKSILDMHENSLNYKYIKGFNIFEIKLN